MLSLPASIEWIRIMALDPTFARPGAPQRSRCSKIQVLLDEFLQIQVLTHDGPKQQAGVGDRVRAVERCPKTVQGVG